MRVNDLSKSEYSSFYQTYIEECGNKMLIEGLKENLKETLQFYKSIPTEKEEHRYDRGKWTIKELLQHIIDSERVFCYRALRFSRQDKTDLPGFEQDDYVPVSNANQRSLKDLIEEFEILRKSSICLFTSFDQQMLVTLGNANNNQMSVRAIGFIIVGHVNHHTKIIKDRYL